MYLSRLVLNPRSREVRRDLSDCHALHRTLLSAFGDAGGADARSAFGVLHRLEIDRRSGTALVLVQSDGAPAWGRLPSGYVVDVAEKDVTLAFDGLRADHRLRFRLRANPTKKIDTKTGADVTRRNGKRVDLRREEDRLAWLRRKGEAGGFRLEAARVVADAPGTNAGPPLPNVHLNPESAVHGRRSEYGTVARLTFGSALFEGVLHVTDPVTFRQTLAAGIGSGKAYGFGLLSVAPA